MQIHTLQTNNPLKKKKRIGRGGKRGSYSGRGIKGQRARAGRKIPSEVKKIIAKFPKLYGVGNTKRSPSKKTYAVVKLKELNKLNVESVKLSDLVSAGLVSARTKKVKILDDGEITKPLTVQGIKVSKSAREKIEKAGGKVV